MALHIFQKLAVASASVVLSLGVVIDALPSQSATIASNYSGSVYGGYSKGKGFTYFAGSFSFDDSKLTGVGNETAKVDLNFRFTAPPNLGLGGIVFSRTSDTFNAVFINGKLRGLEGSKQLVNITEPEPTYLLKFFPTSNVDENQSGGRAVILTQGCSFNECNLDLVGSYVYEPYTRPTSVPEPGDALSLVGLGVLGVAGLLRKKQMQKSGKAIAVYMSHWR